MSYPAEVVSVVLMKVVGLDLHGCCKIFQDRTLHRCLNNIKTNQSNQILQDEICVANENEKKKIEQKVFYM